MRLMSIILLLIHIKIRIKLCMLFLTMALSRCTKLELIHCHVQEKTIDNRFPRNEIRTQSSIKCKQMASVDVKMVDHILITAGFP